MQLSIDTRKKLHDILLDSYPGVASFATVLTLLGKNIEDFSTDVPRPDKYVQIIVAAEAGNWELRLISAIWGHQGSNKPIQDRLLGLTEQVRQERALAESAITSNTLFENLYTDESDDKFEDALQRTVRRGVPDAEVQQYFKNLEKAKNAVCSIQCSGEHQGTGFLIGEKTVITNQHVIASMIDENINYLSARFGFERGLDQQIQNGSRLEFADNWLVFSRDPDPSDKSDSVGGPPSPENLDYAIIRLKESPVSISPLGLNDVRRVKKGNDVVLIHHPSGAPKKVSFGRVKEVSDDAKRMRYDANTKSGSSGSPVLDHIGHLVGLHHAGDPSFDQMATYNQAVPLGLIHEDMTANGVEVI